MMNNEESAAFYLRVSIAENNSGSLSRRDNLCNIDARQKSGSENRIGSNIAEFGVINIKVQTAAFFT